MLAILILGFVFYMGYLEVATSVENWLDTRRWEKELRNRK